MKPIGIVAATLTTGIVAAYGAFHIRENVDTLLKIEYALAVEETELDIFLKQNPDKFVDLEKMRKYSVRLNELGDQKRRIIGTIGIQQNPRGQN